MGAAGEGAVDRCRNPQRCHAREQRVILRLDQALTDCNGLPYVAGGVSRMEEPGVVTLGEARPEVPPVLVSVPSEMQTDG
jgi:hypothetical protein